MGRGSKYFKEIQHLLEIGYEKKQIVEITGCSKATVDRVTRKLKIEARFEFKNLLTEDFLWKYQKTLENYSRTIQQCNEEITKMNDKYDTIELKINTELEDMPENKAMTRATLLGSLIQVQSSRTNELIKICATRDRATGEKARVYNQGPVMYAMDEWVNNTNPQQGELPHVEEVTALSANTINAEVHEIQGAVSTEVISDEDEQVLKEMEEVEE